MTKKIARTRSSSSTLSNLCLTPTTDRTITSAPSTRPSVRKERSFKASWFRTLCRPSLVPASGQCALLIHGRRLFFFFFFFHLGREWNTAEHHKRETRPAIETVPGAIIKPMKLTKV